MITKEQGKGIIKKLIDTFRYNIQQYSQTSYKEAHVRKEFIDKFFVALGWDVNNEEGASERYKEVINEDAIKIGGKTKAPDYAFRIGGTRIFFAEAKKPSVNIKQDSEPAFQLRRYAWNSKIPISILTDFQEFVVYDCRIKPDPKDSPVVGRLFYINYEQYLDRFEEIWDIFSKEAVLRGSFDRYVESNKGKKGTSEVDSEFLKEIEQWREDLAKNIALRNQVSISELNFVVQKIIDRILFLRICEDKSIEPYEKLRNIAEKPEIYRNLMTYFKYADDKYDSGIFDFKKDNLSGKIIIDDKVLKDVIMNLYYPHSPYDFSVLSIEILGNVYEQFLGKTITLTASNRAKVEEKPDVRKAGGVYYTPEYVVDYIVENTVGTLIEGKTPKEIERIKILDPACGSGTFLVRAYSYLLEHHLSYYLKNPQKNKKEIYQVKENQWYLTTELRKKILLNNIFGVDIDSQAVELAKLSLLLKVLENETKESVNQQLKLFQERALPNLDKNIRCGNSLVNSSYFKQATLTPNAEEISKINPFDWDDKENGFGNILTEGGFDVVIGNPPYVKEYTNREIFETLKKTDMAKYYQGKMDFWYLFTCKAMDIMREKGLHSFIAQNNWITSAGASILRNKILAESKLLSFFDFNDFKVFKDASIQTMVFVIEKTKPPKAYNVNYYKIINKKISKEELRNYLLTGKDGNSIEKFKAKIEPQEIRDKTISFVNTPIGDIFEKMRNSRVFYLTEKEITNGVQVQQECVNKSHLKMLGSGFKLGEGIFIISDDEKNKLHLTEKEKELIKPLFTPNEIDRYKIDNKNKYWVIYTGSKFRNPAEIKPYPHIKEHLDRFRKIITTDFKPYGIHRTRDERFFKGEKIVSIRKCPVPSFSFVNFDSYVNQVYYVIKTERINMKFLTGLLNSKLLHFWLYHKGKRQGEQLQVDKAPLLELPIYKLEDSNKQEKKIKDEIIKSVEAITEIKKKLETVNLNSEKLLLEKQINALEEKIDDMIYKLYDVSDDEKKIIEESLK